MPSGDNLQDPMTSAKRYKLVRINPPNGHTLHDSREEAETVLRSELPQLTITQDAQGRRYVDQDGNRVALIRESTSGSSGSHANPRRLLTAKREQWEEMDEAADDEPWSRWALRELLLAARRKRMAGRKRPSQPSKTATNS